MLYALWGGIFCGTDSAGLCSFYIFGIYKDILNTIQKNRDAIIDNSLKELSRSSLPHYSENSETVNRERLTFLLNKTIECIEAKNLLPMTVYAEEIAQKRFEKGYLLQEVQTAFNVLEEILWQLLIKEINPPDYPEALGIVSSIMGAGKQPLAIEYVSLVTGKAKQEKDIARLFFGT